MRIQASTIKQITPVLFSVLLAFINPFGWSPEVVNLISIFFIGWNRELARLNNAHRTNSQSYPPYDLLKLDEDTYKLSLAVAGFSKDDIDVSVDNGSLVIKGELVEVTDAEVVHKGIAGRKFTRTFALGEYMEVTGAELKDGMLTIHIDRIVPEEKKPKSIKIK
jgi:molecular chaperone IbpA